MQDHVTLEYVALENAILKEVDILGIFGISKATLERLKKTRGLPHIKLGRGRTIYTDSAVMRWLDEHMTSEGEDK